MKKEEEIIRVFTEKELEEELEREYQMATYEDRERQKQGIADVEQEDQDRRDRWLKNYIEAKAKKDYKQVRKIELGKCAEELAHAKLKLRIFVHKAVESGLSLEEIEPIVMRWLPDDGGVWTMIQRECKINKSMNITLKEK